MCIFLCTIMIYMFSTIKKEFPEGSSSFPNIFYRLHSISLL